jgi:D-alanyl-D-alanine carboxypeptidase
MGPRLRSLLLAACIGMAAVWCAPAAAPALSLGSHCAALLDPATGKLLYGKNPDSLCYTGSTAKAVTIYVAIRAVRKGFVSLSNEIPFSLDSTQQACQCLGNYVVNPTPQQTAHPDQIAVPGEKMSLDDSLYGADMSAVEPTVSLAEYVANAELNGHKSVGSTVSKSEALRLQFVSLMNKLFKKLGLTKSHFANEDGASAPLGNLPVPKSTAREMVEFWKHAERDSLFVPHMGLRNLPVTTTLPGGGHGHYLLDKWYGYYPGVLGDKEGGVTPKTVSYFSMFGSAKRLGRTLIFDVMQNKDLAGGSTEFSDSGNLLQYGFEKIFNPARRGDSGSQGDTATADAIDCWGSHRCLTASRTGAGTLQLTTWGIHVGSNKVNRLYRVTGHDPTVNEVAVSLIGQQTICRPPGSMARVASNGCTLGNRLAISSERTGADQITLKSWNVADNGRLTKLSSSDISGRIAQAAGAGGTGTDIALADLSTSKFISAYRQDDGTLRLDSWSVANDGTLTNLGTIATTGGIESFAMVPASGGGGVVTDVRTTTGLEKLINWSVSSTGAITRIGDSGDQGKSLDDLSLTRISSTEYMSAGQSGGVPAVDVWELGANGSFTLDGDMTSIPATSVTETSIVRLGTHAPLLAVKSGAHLELVPMEYLTAYEHEPLGPHNDSYYPLGSASAGSSSSIHLGRVTATHAVGDFVSAVVAGGHLKLINWRVGANP